MLAKDRCRWGIIGTGFAATQFVNGLAHVQNAEVSVVASRTVDRAKEFASEYSVPTSVGSYEELIKREDVDIVYVGAVASLHHQLCLDCIAHQKPVLCEKPFATSSTQATEIASAARDAKVFCMEAMWTRFIPLMKLVRSLVHDGAIGRIHSVSGDFGIRATAKSHPRLFEPASGGALLDLGVYPVALSVDLMGKPESVSWFCRHSSDGSPPVIEHASGAFQYANGSTAQVSADILCATPTRATIVGSEGYLELTPLYRPTRALLHRAADPETVNLISKIKRRLGFNVETLRSKCVGNGYQYQAIEAMNCISDGKTESDIMPLEDSVTTLEIIERSNQLENVSGSKDGINPALNNARPGRAVVV